LDLQALMKNDEGVTSHLGLEFTELAPERVVATMPVDGRHHQPFGYLHGGVSVVLAESVASIAGQGRLRRRDQREPRPPQKEWDPHGCRRPGPPGTHEPGLGGPHNGRERQDGLRLPLHRRRRGRRIVLTRGPLLPCGVAAGRRRLGLTDGVKGSLT
jgi:hypothetical protein